MGTSIGPLSIDDEIASDHICDMSCMATPWLLSMGFTIAMSALFSKLWRINKLFGQRPTLQRRQVREKDVLAPLVILFTLNFIFLLTWTLAAPMTWERRPVSGEIWNTYGTCVASGPVSIAMLSSVVALNGIALLLAGYQAYQARRISDEFSESRQLGVALFSWVQIGIVALPVLFLIDDDNPTAKYFVEVAVIFVFCMSMLLILFVPIVVQFHTDWKVSRRNLQSIILASSNFGSRHPRGRSQFGHGTLRVSGLDSSDGFADFTNSTSCASPTTSPVARSTLEQPESILKKSVVSFGPLPPLEHGQMTSTLFEVSNEQSQSSPSDSSCNSLSDMAMIAEREEKGEADEGCTRECMVDRGDRGIEAVQ